MAAAHARSHAHLQVLTGVKTVGAGGGGLLSTVSSLASLATDFLPQLGK